MYRLNGPLITASYKLTGGRSRSPLLLNKTCRDSRKTTHFLRLYLPQFHIISIEFFRLENAMLKIARGDSQRKSIRFKPSDASGTSVMGDAAKANRHWVYTVTEMHEVSIGLNRKYLRKNDAQRDVNNRLILRATRSRFLDGN